MTLREELLVVWDDLHESELRAVEKARAEGVHPLVIEMLEACAGTTRRLRPFFGSRRATLTLPQKDSTP